MKKLVVAAAVSVVLLTVFAVGDAVSHPNIHGQEGLIKMPASDVLGQKGFTAGFSTVNGKNRIYANFGIVDRFDLGLNYRVDKNGSPVATAKYQVLVEDADQPALSVGLVDSSIYVVGSKRMDPPQLRLHFGLGTEDYSLPMVGVSYMLNPVQLSTDGSEMPNISIVGELIDGKVNIGVQADFASHLGLTAGIINFENLAAGLSITQSF